MPITQTQIDEVDGAISKCIQMGQSGSKGDRQLAMVQFEQLVKYKDKLQKQFDLEQGTTSRFPAINQGILKSL